LQKSYQGFEKWDGLMRKGTVLKGVSHEF
jgi:hypothetical protein